MLYSNDQLKNIAIKKLEKQFNVHANRILDLNPQPHDKPADNDDFKKVKVHPVAVYQSVICEWIIRNISVKAVLSTND